MKILVDTHTHTIASGHAYSTLQENAKAAAEKGMEMIAMTDHGPAAPGSPHIYHFDNLRSLPKEIYGVRVLKGCEANIINFEGELDIKQYLQKELEFIIASIHPSIFEVGNEEQNTNAIINAIKNPYIDVIGHPDDSRIPINYEKIIKAAKEYNKLIEINNSSLAITTFRQGVFENVSTMLKLSKEYKSYITVSSDAHFSEAVGNFENAKKILKDLDFPEDLIINTSKEKIINHLKTNGKNI